MGGDGDAGEHGRIHDRGCGFFRHVMSVCEDPRLKQSSGHENLSQLTQPIQYGKQHHLSPNLNGHELIAALRVEREDDKNYHYVKTLML